VGVQFGDGIVARFGPTVIVAEAGTGPEDFTNLALAELDAPGADANDIAWRVAELLLTHRDSAPAFGLVIGHDAGFQILLHGAIRAVVDGDGELTARDVLTWLDRRIPDPVRSIALTLSPSGGVQPDPRTDLRGGLVPGGGLVLVPAPVEGEPEPAPVVANVAEPEPEPVPVPDPEPAPVVAEPEPEPAPEQEPEPTPELSPVVADVAEPEPEPEPAPEPDPEPASLFIPRTEPDVALVPPLEPDGALVAPDEPQFEAPVAPQPDPLPARAEPVAPLGFFEPVAAVRPQSAASDDEPTGPAPAPNPTEELPAYPSLINPAPRPAAPTPASSLLADDGSRLRLDHPLVFGREPQQDASVAAGQAEPIRLADTEHMISRVQAYLFVDGPSVRIKDANSANGTFIAAPGAPEWDRLGEDAVELPIGWSIRMGRRVFTHQNG
jgi:hypothetical protein